MELRDVLLLPLESGYVSSLLKIRLNSIFAFEKSVDYSPISSGRGDSNDFKFTPTVFFLQWIDPSSYATSPPATYGSMNNNNNTSCKLWHYGDEPLVADHLSCSLSAKRYLNTELSVNAKWLLAVLWCRGSSVIDQWRALALSSLRPRLTCPLVSCKVWTAFLC